MSGSNDNFYHSIWAEDLSRSLFILVSMALLLFLSELFFFLYSFLFLSILSFLFPSVHPFYFSFWFHGTFKEKQTYLWLILTQPVRRMERSKSEQWMCVVKMNNKVVIDDYYCGCYDIVKLNSCTICPFRNTAKHKNCSFFLPFFKLCFKKTPSCHWCL